MTVITRSRTQFGVARGAKQAQIGDMETNQPSSLVTRRRPRSATLEAAQVSNRNRTPAPGDRLAALVATATNNSFRAVPSDVALRLGHKNLRRHCGRSASS